MKRSSHITPKILCFAVLLAATLPAMPASAAGGAPAPGLNLLSNPAHEHPGVYFAGRGEINVTWNWVPFWQEPPAGADPRDQNYRTPEFRPVFASQYPERVLSGGGADRWFNYFALNKEAGIMQEVKNLPVGAPVRFTTWVQLWSSNENTQPPRSTKDGNMLVRVCVDQNGGPRDMTDPNLKCSEWAQPYDKYAQISVDAIALNSTVLALIQSTASIPVEHNDAYADDSCFEILPAAGAKGICLGAGAIGSAVDMGVVGDVLAAPWSKEAAAKAAAAVAAAKPATTAAAPASGSSVSAPAGEAPKTVVTTAVLNVRDKPGLNTTVIGKLAKGDVADVTGKSADGAWFQIKYQNAAAWIYAAYTTPNAAAKAAPVVQ
jgi:hypothetical protein